MADVTLVATNGANLFDVLDLGYPSLTNITVNLGGGNDEIRSAAGNDFILGGKGRDTIYAGLGNDYINAGNQADFVDGGKGDDTILGGGGGDTLKAGAGDDQLFGGNGSDTLLGVKGNNLLDGGKGNDYIDTGVHSSVALGGSGSDTFFIDLSKGAHHMITGGANIDHFIFAKTEASRTSITTVTDFKLGLETFEIEGVDDVSFMTELLTGINGASLEDGDDGAVLYLASDDHIVFNDLTAASIIDHYDDFLIV